MLGEVEIAGQVRTAWELSRRLGLCGPILETLFEEALRVAGTIRGETRIGAGRVSLAEIAVDLIREHVSDAPGRVALIGVSPMTERAAVSLHAAGIPLLIVNRTLERAQALAALYGAEARSLAEFAHNPPPLEAVLSATGATDPLLDKEQIERLAARTPTGDSPLIVDMSIPPDFDPEVCLALDIPRVSMDEITRRAEQNRSARLLEAAQARELVDEALQKTNERFAERYSGRLFGALQQRYRRTAEEGVKRLLKKDLAHLNPAEQAAVETWAAALARRFAHIPCLGLRGLLHAGPEGSLEAFLGGLEPEFAEELRLALQGTPQARADSHAA
jgi:glutamyl-tRNA reductase